MAQEHFLDLMKRFNAEEISKNSAVTGLWIEDPNYWNNRSITSNRDLLFKGFGTYIVLFSSKPPASNGLAHLLPPFFILLMVLLVTALLNIVNSSWSSSSSSSSEKTVTSQQLYKIVKGCCSGVGGTYRSSYDEGCVVDSEQDKPFRDCVGKGKVKYPNGQVGNYYGSNFTR